MEYETKLLFTKSTRETKVDNSYIICKFILYHFLRRLLMELRISQTKIRAWLWFKSDDLKVWFKSVAVSSYTQVGSQMRMVLNMPFYLQMSKNITQQRNIYDTVIFRFLQIFYGVRIHIYIYIQLSINCILEDNISKYF